jgi:uncharacterized protein YgfB (UPF0149 family)
MVKKIRHNKRRNTAFLYEALVRELTKAVVDKDDNRQKVVTTILREHFAMGSEMRHELRLYRTLMRDGIEDKQFATRLVFGVLAERYNEVDQRRLFVEQTSLIKKIQSRLSSDVFKNFVPNYRTLATIAQLFDPKTAIDKRVLLEGKMVEMLQTVEEEKKNLKPLDDLSYRVFVKKFNEKYGSLQENQQKLLKYYIFSFTDNGIALKTFLNEEVGRLRQEVSEIVGDEDVKNDALMLENAKKVSKMLENFGDEEINEKAVNFIYQVQSLIQEAKEKE